MFKAISIIGGVSLIIFGIFYVVRTLRKNDNLTATDNPSRIENPILAGILFTGVNPFFFLWWISVGVKLISYSAIAWISTGDSFSLFRTYMDGLCVVRSVFIFCVKRY
ncbi:MAG: LysE family translocator [Thermoproteota archaeon]|nr:LysE family translocator [Thermoproteota archaeon]